jgi:aminopeptidase N
MLKEATPRAIFLSEYQSPEYQILKTDLSLDIGEAATRVYSRLTVRRGSGIAADTPLVLDGVDLELLAVAVDGVPLGSNQYRRDELALTLFDLPDEAVISIETVIHPDLNTALEGLYRSGGMYCTQCEAEGFRRITYYLDRPDVQSVFTTTITADGSRYPVLLANGNRVADRDLGGGRRAVTWHDPHPKPSYLFAAVAGDLAVRRDRFVTGSGRAVTLEIFSEPHNIEQCGYAMESLKRAMRWDEERYGREYDLDVYMIVAVEDFNMGAMENKGLNIFNTACVLASPDTATDAAYQRVEAVVAHEYFHNWSGNRVTCRDWFQLSLKEGFTVFRDAEFSADMHSRTVKRIEDVTVLRTVQFAEDAGPLAHPVRPASYIEISNFYTPTVYEKGAEVVRMLHTLLGPEAFRRGCDQYFERHDGSAATTDDFVAAMAEAGGLDLDQFQRWYDQAGTPQLTVSEQFGDGCLTLRIAQRCPPTPGQPDKVPFHLPVLFGLIGPDGGEIDGGSLDADSDQALHWRPDDKGGCGSFLLELRAGEASVRLSGLAARPRVSLLRGFSAPVRVDFARPDGDLAFLVRHDSDGFARWDALQTLVVAEIERLRHNGGEPADPLVELFIALAREAADAAEAARPDEAEIKSLLAVMLTLPDPGYLFEQATDIDIDGTCDALAALQRALASRGRPAWERLLDLNRSDGAFSTEPRAMARRALGNAALAMLTPALDAAEAARRLAERYRGADNLTDRRAALCQLMRHETVDPMLRRELLDDFLTRWRHEALVVDQWLALQAASPLVGAEAVRALAAHAAFDPGNPNKLRALYGTFTRQNPRRFHERDGSGYRLLADVVAELDGRNPAMASALAKPLTRWRRMDAARAEHMRRALESIAGVEGLSRDVYEVVTKSLAPSP